MKKLFTSLFALALMTSANAQNAGARVYAYELTQTDGDNVTVTFKTNVTAKTAKVILFADGKENIEVPATSEDGITWSAVVEPNASFVADVNYNWKAEVSNDAITTAMVFFGKGFNRPSTLAIDNNPESPYFGNLYMTENVGGGGNAYDTKATETGMYSFDAALTNVTFTTQTFIGDQKRSSSPRAMTIATDGTIYLSACDEQNQGIYTIDPSDFSGEQILSGKKVFGISANGDDIYYVEQDADGVYSIASLDTEFTPFATSIKDYGTYPHNSIVAVEQGIWVHYADASGVDETKNHLHFVDYTGDIKWSINNTVKTDRGGIAVDVRNNTLAYYSKDNGAIYYNYKFTENGSIELGEMAAVPTDQVASGSRSEAMAFDYAGNLYLISSGGEWLKAIGLPTENNTCATPAKKDMTISFSKAEIEASGIAEIGADVNVPVEFYNLQGVKVENPSNGVFIKKQGSKAAKVIL